MFKKTKNVLGAFVCAVLIFQLTGCGTLLYPERKGQKGGRIDIGVAVLDGIGLFFFLIPGLIAYAVDFSNGTIYLPSSAGSLDPDDIKQVKFDPAQSTLADIEEIIKTETGCDVAPHRRKMKIVALESADELEAHFVQAMRDREDARIVSISR